MRLACIKPRQWFLVIEIVGCSHLEALEMGIRAGNEPSRSLNFYNLVEGPSLFSWLKTATTDFTYYKELIISMLTNRPVRPVRPDTPFTSTY